MVTTGTNTAILKFRQSRLWMCKIMWIWAALNEDDTLGVIFNTFSFFFFVFFFFCSFYSEFYFFNFLLDLNAEPESR